MINSLYDCFTRWSIGGSIWILSDTHFDDSDCKLMDKKWISPEKQVEIINSHVFKGDTFIHLGDVGSEKYLDQIKCKNRILILGNHDQSKARYSRYFDEIFDGAIFIAPKILLSHEPIGVPFALNIHGHDHNGMERYKDGCKYLNLAANVCNYTPVNLGKMIKQGILADIPSIHRITIDKATEKKVKRLDNGFDIH